ncbi:hypothetical protein [Aquimarina aggregata]|nr:hypothetical protein [Aquimarina aggregata]
MFSLVRKVTLLSICMSLLSFFNYNHYSEKLISPDNYSYYSDYFVFIADDEAAPLVIPLDMNWSINPNGYTKEFKSWYGTKNHWPIAYVKKKVTSAFDSIPKESWEHISTKTFQFQTTTRQIITKIPGAPAVHLTIPEKSKWVAMPSDTTEKEIYAFRTTAKVKKKIRKGWMIYERIRWSASAVKNFGDFETFFWIPLVINGDFFHFEQHKGKQTATKWSFNGTQVKVSSLPSFILQTITTTKDKISGRDNIPKTIQVQAPEWNLDITLKSSGSQVGHGAKFANGLAYYRQSLLEPTKTSKTKGYGMLELIIEND